MHLSQSTTSTKNLPQPRQHDSRGRGHAPAVLCAWCGSSASSALSNYTSEFSFFLSIPFGTRTHSIHLTPPPTHPATQPNLRYLVLSTEKERKDKQEAEKAQREREKTLTREELQEAEMVDRTFVGKFKAQDVDFDKLDMDQDKLDDVAEADEDEDEDDEEEMPESKVGETLSQLTTQRVIMIILVMLIAVQLLENPPIDRRDETAALLMHSFGVANSSFFNTQNASLINESSLVTQDAYRAITGIIAETNADPFETNQLALVSVQIGSIAFPVPNAPTHDLRNMELAEFRFSEMNGTDTSTVLLETKAVFTTRQVVRETGMWNMILTLFAMMMLMLAAYIASNDVVSGKRGALARYEHGVAQRSQELSNGGWVRVASFPRFCFALFCSAQLYSASRLRVVGVQRREGGKEGACMFCFALLHSLLPSSALLCSALLCSTRPDPGLLYPTLPWPALRKSISATSFHTHAPSTPCPIVHTTTAHSRFAPSRGHGPDYAGSSTESPQNHHSHSPRAGNLQKRHGDDDAPQHHHQDWWDPARRLWRLWRHDHQEQPQRGVGA